MHTRPHENMYARSALYSRDQLLGDYEREEARYIECRSERPDEKIGDDDDQPHYNRLYSAPAPDESSGMNLSRHPAPSRLGRTVGIALTGPIQYGRCTGRSAVRSSVKGGLVRV